MTSSTCSYNRSSYEETDDIYSESDTEPELEDERSLDRTESTSTTTTSTSSSDTLNGGLLRDPRFSNLIWTGIGRKTPLVLFSTEAVLKRDRRLATLSQRYHLSYKIVKTDAKIVRSVLNTHGFRDAGVNSSEVNLIWTGSQIKPAILKHLASYQKINHFPRSYEITRKDCLYKNVKRMQTLKGFKNFDFMPESFLLPTEFQDFSTAFLRAKGPFIVKPIASSCGRGIFLINRPDQVPLDEQLIVSRYITNPFLIDGFKFDVRLYVSVTSYDPLVVYIFEEGLVRFATVKYQTSCRNLKSQCMHLTNYSVNKKNLDFVHNDDAEVEDFGNKWSLGALLRYLKSLGKDTTALMMRIEDVVIKAILSAEMTITSACRMFQANPSSCFELYGFDIILDDSLRPWLLEVNLSPSLACDSPLDLKIKSHMLTNLFNLTGIVCHDPRITPSYMKKSNNPLTPKCVHEETCIKSKPGNKQARLSKDWAAPPPSTSSPSLKSLNKSWLRKPLDDVREVRRVLEEYQRRGGWVRICPRRDSWHSYHGLYESAGSTTTTATILLHQKLFPSLWFPSPTLPPFLVNLADRARAPLHSLSESTLVTAVKYQSQNELSRRLCLLYKAAGERVLLYQRKLGARRQTSTVPFSVPSTHRQNVVQSVLSSRSLKLTRFVPPPKDETRLIRPNSQIIRRQLTDRK